MLNQALFNTNSLDGTTVRSSWHQELHKIIVVCGTASPKNRNKYTLKYQN